MDGAEAGTSGSRGSLAVVGIGYAVAAHASLETRRLIAEADRLLYLVQGELAPVWLHQLNPNGESLADCYGEGRCRYDTYAEMVGRILAPVRRGERVCAVFYGHPAVFARPTHEAVRQARREGFPARLLPAISAEDCLFADLEVDPSAHGCQSFEATDFLVRRPRFDPTAALILWQIGNIASPGYRTIARIWNPAGLRILVETLRRDYPATHGVVAYVAANTPMARPVVQRLPLTGLAGADLSPASTLYVPPIAHRPVDREMLARLGLDSYPDRGDR